MSLFMNCVRKFVHNHSRYKTAALTSRLPIFYRQVHRTCSSAQFYQPYENQYAYNLLEKKGYMIRFQYNEENSTLNEQQFEKLVATDWSTKTPSEIFETFPVLAVYCSNHNLCISNQMFDKYIDFLTDNIKFATDNELQTLFYDLKKWPRPQSVRTRNYIEVWVALDDECVNRIKNWSHSEVLTYISLFYMLNLTKYNDFLAKGLNKLASKAKQLKTEEFVQTLLYVGIWRNSPFDMHNLEIELKNNFSNFSVDDLAIISMGFFKSKTPLRDTHLILKIIDLVIENSKNIHEVSLAALLKVIRYSTKMTPDDRIHRLLDTLQHEVPRLSLMCNVHIALLGTTTMNMHKECLNAVAENVIDRLSETRLKDLERLVLTYGTFNYIPPTKECLFKKIMDELRKPERITEINNHGRTFACLVAYLSILNIYPEDLISRVFEENFLTTTYGKYIANYGREVLTLHHIADIYCKNPIQNCLNDKSMKILAKKFTDYVPSEEFHKQYNITEKMVLDVIKVLRESRGGPQYVVGDHILPYHQRGDIIICDDHNGAPVDISNMFLPKDFGILHRPPNDEIWTVLVIAGRNATIYGTDTSTGPFISKIRDLKTIGYNATLVPWTVYSKLQTDEEKLNYLNTLIKNCTQNKNI